MRSRHTHQRHQENPMLRDVQRGQVFGWPHIITQNTKAVPALKLAGAGFLWVLCRASGAHKKGRSQKHSQPQSIGAWRRTPAVASPTVLCTSSLPGVDDGFWLGLDCSWEKPKNKGNSKRIVTFFLSTSTSLSSVLVSKPRALCHPNALNFRSQTLVHPMPRIPSPSRENWIPLYSGAPPRQRKSPAARRWPNFIRSSCVMGFVLC